MEDTAQSSESKFRKLSWGIKCVAFLLGLLLYWGIDFVLNDIVSFKPAPVYEDMEKAQLSPDLVRQNQTAMDEQTALNQQIESLKGRQELLSSSSKDMSDQVSQLLETKRVLVQQGKDLDSVQLDLLKKNQQHIHDNSDKFQSLNVEIEQVNHKNEAVNLKIQEFRKQLDEQRDKIRKDYGKTMEAYKMRIGFYQLVMLVPFMLLALFLLVRRRKSSQRAIHYALAGAIALETASIIQDCFTTRYSKYILIAVSIVLLWKLLSVMIRNFLTPKADFLLKRNRQAYDKYECPECDFPIRVGPLKYLLNRKKMAKGGALLGTTIFPEEEYTCPSCGTGLFKTCSSCQKVRHTLLPHCSHCGNG